MARESNESGPCTAWRMPYNLLGRATRTEFWVFILTGTISFWLLVAAYQVLDGIANSGTGSASVWPIFAILGFAAAGLYLLLAYVTVWVRRARDATGSGWWALIVFVPFVGLLAQIVIGLMPSRLEP